VSRENLPWLGLALLLLIGGWFVSQRMLVRLPADEAKIETFREWLWGTRSLDLAVQVGIIFVGALGIAALLPRRNEIPTERAYPPTAVVACDLPPPAAVEETRDEGQAL
jgi:hypothetical protein